VAEVTMVVATMEAVEKNLIPSRSLNPNQSQNLNLIQIQDSYETLLIRVKKIRKLRVVHLDLPLIHALKILLQKDAN
jgi:hypothetical protein